MPLTADLRRGAPVAVQAGRRLADELDTARRRLALVGTREPGSATVNPLSRRLMAKLGKTYLAVNGAVFLASFLFTVVSHYV